MIEPPNHKFYYELLMFCPAWLCWFMKKVSHSTAMKLYGFYSGFPISWFAFQVWGAIMTNDYETSSKRLFGLSWYDEFYGLLSRSYD